MTAAAESRARLGQTADDGVPLSTAADRRRRARHRDAAPRPAAEEWLTVDEVCTELKIGRRTYDRWRRLGKAPRAVRLAGNGPLRTRRSWLEEWVEDCARASA
jgi:predicted DNA-binding transcriptional regulator AlpA